MTKNEAQSKAHDLLAANEIQLAINTLLKYLHGKGSHLEGDISSLKLRFTTLERSGLSRSSAEYLDKITHVKNELIVIIKDLSEPEPSNSNSTNAPSQDGSVGNFWDFLWRLLLNWRLLLLVLGIVALLYAGLRSIHRDPLCLVFNDCKPDTVKVIERALTWAEAQAARATKPYAILSLVQHIKFRDVVEGRKKIRKGYYRNYYTIRALKNIEMNDNVFPEQFLSSMGPGAIRIWAGNEDQNVTATSDNLYWVNFKAAKDEIKTIITGADYSYPFPISPKAREIACFEIIALSDKEWMACYPNSDDYIDRLSIVVEAENFDISIDKKAAYRKNGQASINDTDGICQMYTGSDNCTVVGNWERIDQGQCAAIKIKWL